MRTASLKMRLSEADDFFGPRELGRLLGLNAKRTYELTKQPGFPAKRFGNKIIISKTGFTRWFDEL
ncbi:MAG: DNA-binding protein [Peptococcaceae bacterium]|nr:MAG: DNA-binding protein [Peptococcaceae bacterium]